MNWRTQTAAELGRGIQSGQINPVELTEAFLDAAESDLGRRIYARLTHDRARDEAMAAATRAKDGRRRGPLDGVPISWKDVFDTANIPTEAGSALLAGRTPQTDAPVLTTATLNGLVCLGKTHMSELAFSGLGLNPVTQTPPNINNPDAVAGGSSSGAAASVAFGMAAAAIGMDTAGSVRGPACWNDLVGLKTTFGRLSNDGIVPSCESLDTIGPLARSVEDCALLLSALEGRRPIDLTGSDLSGARIAVLDTVATEDLRDAPAQCFERALSRLGGAGAHVTALRFEPIREAMSFSGPLFTAEGFAIWRDRIEAQPDLMFPRIRERIEAGRAVNAADYIAHVRRLDQIRRNWASATAGYDAVVMPTSPILPPNTQRLIDDADYYTSENLLALRNTRIANMLGLCSLTVPGSVASCGFMLMCPPLQEERLLRLGYATERLFLPGRIQAGLVRN
ncbi:amidase [Falsirhodobacter halotolerans]|uniref:amidase n=1 Tax=Falsirhodobacter halotolerans TaxID=1146892 RepID=UPI001FCFB851|nr:amidase family protein [Falsirhodobacter halotolerans]MCJ8140613.1 amidase family protein [Falsirhodobacter halotolerans]